MAGLHFVNTFSDYAGEEWLLPDGEVETGLRQHLIVEVNLHTSEVLKAHKKGRVSADDHSVYTGSAGTALLLVQLFKRTGLKPYLKMALDLLEPSLQSLSSGGTSGHCSFLCGDVGPLCVAAVAYHLEDPPMVEKRDYCISRVVQLHQSVITPASAEPLSDEVFSGRAGYLYSLLYLERHIGGGCVAEDVIERVVTAILESGKRMRNTACPLLYTWKGKHYFGAAYGMAGIYLQLLQVAARFPHLNIAILVKRSIDYLLTVRMLSGNCPSTLELVCREKVQWCHGAPGWIFMLCAAYKAFRDQKYLSAARECADVVWSRGLLHLGNSLCHGVSGNAYSFLAVFQLTGDMLYLHRACKFAEWLFESDKHGCPVADKPYSLFGGTAGVGYFLLDLQTPRDARFPAFEL